MASAHIEVSGSATRLNGELRAFVDLLRQTCERGAKLKAIADQAALGGDWGGLSAAFGLSEADAETVYNLLGSVNTELAGAFISQMRARLG